MEFDPDIFDAIEFGDFDTVQRYWTDQINIDFQDNLGRTMLMLAVYYEFVDIVIYLLWFNPDLELRNKDGQTALDIANNKKNGLISDLLMKARNNEPSRAGSTPSL